MTPTQFNLAMTRAITATWYEWTYQLDGRKIVAYNLSPTLSPLALPNGIVREVKL